MKKILNLLKKALPFILCGLILFTPFISLKNSGATSAEKEKILLEIWQIDNFEGGKGSRASYLQKIGNKFSDDIYVQVSSLSAEAARNNLQRGTIPDIISYGAGIAGIENYITGKCYTWCHGGYCVLTLQSGADFSDITFQNTVINVGIDNLSSAAALFLGVSDADTFKPTGAYVSLLNGKYKYLLGTQRDILRLKTRNADFEILPLTQFNDLYQNISIIAGADTKKKAEAQKFIEFLLKSSENLADLGLFSDSINLYNDEMNKMEGINYEYTIKSPMSNEARDSVISAIKNKDLNLLKSLLK